MAWSPQERGGAVYSWRRVWYTPLGVFMAALVVIVATLGWAFFDFREEILERRRQFCVSENTQATAQRIFWEGVLDQFATQDDHGYVTLPNGTRLSVTFTQEMSARERKEFRDFVNQTFVVRNCR